MAVLKCKMCGGDLNLTADEKIVECEFCGTTQTIPDGNDEKKTNLFNRANRLRIANEFDKASGIYESIIAEFPDEAESYWGLCLCKFGIEYVDDPKTAKKIPTCHRTSFESIFDDENYKTALEKSDVVARDVYKKEATVIDNLQKDILSIVHKEEPFDVFICYKETDDFGERTQDSVLAQDIYDALTAKGFKVFFSRITLEDKLGKQYEPYIFAALNSAKIMLAIGTKEEYYNAVWVKNEWSRFLALMEKDKEKMLIPCYRDIDPYDMPQEFKNLQGQDMSKLGFLQDLVRGIAKIISPEQEKQTQKETIVSTGTNATADSLLKRAFMFLEDGNWQSANEYCEKVLDINPECAEAYLGKLMESCHARKREEIKNSETAIEAKDSFKKAVRFGDDALKSELNSYVLAIRERKETERKEDILRNVKAEMRKNTVFGYEQALELLKNIPSYKDSPELAAECKEKISELREKKIIDDKNHRYNKALNLMKRRTINDLKEAKNILKSLFGWMDSEAKLKECDEIIQKLESLAEETRKANAEKARIRKEKLAQYEAEFPEMKNKKTIEKQYADKKEAVEKIKSQLELAKVHGCLVGWGIGQFTLGALVLVLGVGAVIGIINLIFGTAILAPTVISTFRRIRFRKELDTATSEYTELEKKLEELKSIPTFEEWLKEEK